MKKPAAISIGFHAAILLATLVALPAPKPFDVKLEEAIQVDITQITDKTQKVATATEAAPKIEKPAPKQTKITKDVPPAPKVADEVKTAANEPAIPPEPVVEKKPEPPKPKPPKPVEPTPPDPTALTDLLKKSEEPPPEKKTEPKPKVEKPVEAKKPEKKKPELKLDDISAFLDKQKGEKTAPQKPKEKTGSPKLAAADAQGNDQVVTATLINALTSKVKQCFNVPPAARDANISVRIHFILNTDGSVAGQPEVATVNSDPIFDATARAAVSAILECQNYDLPPDQYELWKDNTLDFNPNLLFGT